MIAVCNIWRYNQWKKGFVVDEIVLTRTEPFFIAPQLLVLHYFYFFKSLVDNSEMTDNSKKWQQMKKSVVISNKVMETSTCCFLFGWKTTSMAPFSIAYLTTNPSLLHLPFIFPGFWFISSKFVTSFTNLVLVLLHSSDSSSVCMGWLVMYKGWLSRLKSNWETTCQ